MYASSVDGFRAHPSRIGVKPSSEADTWSENSANVVLGVAKPVGRAIDNTQGVTTGVGSGGGDGNGVGVGATPGESKSKTTVASKASSSCSDVPSYQN